MSATWGGPIHPAIDSWLRGEPLPPLLSPEPRQCELCDKTTANYVITDVPVPQEGGWERIVVCSDCQGIDE